MKLRTRIMQKTLYTGLALKYGVCDCWKKKLMLPSGDRIQNNFFIAETQARSVNYLGNKF